MMLELQHLRMKAVRELKQMLLPSHLYLMQLFQHYLVEIFQKKLLCLLFLLDNQLIQMHYQ